MGNKSRTYLLCILIWSVVTLSLFISGTILSGLTDSNGVVLFGSIADLLKKITLLMFVLLAVFMLTCIVYLIIKDRRITKKIKECHETKNYEELVEYLNNEISKAWIDNIELSCKAHLISTYLIINNTEEARKLLDETKWYTHYVHIAYYKMLFCLKDNNYEEAQKEYNYLLQNKNRYFDNQRRLGEKLLKMVETNEYDESIISETQLPLVKEICDRYKPD